MSLQQQQSAAKPSLQGVRIKARKGAVKAQAKHEPTGTNPPRARPLTFYSLSAYTLNFTVVFRDQLYKHLEAIPQGDYDAVTNKLIQAGSTLEFLKYADALFDILIVGGLLQPGGLYLDAEGPTSPFSLFQINVSAEPEELKKFVEVLNKLIRR
jgi:hypothetical protein